MQMELCPSMPPARRPAARSSVVQPPAPPVVDPRWLLQAGAAVLALAMLCAYVSLCALFYSQQSQLVLHPSRTVAPTPSSATLAFTPVRFADDPGGQPQLTGWWIPGDVPSQPVVLMLHGESGSMADALPAARALHGAGLQVFLFDYRGYGESAGRHPTEATMRADAESALHYLEADRQAAPAQIVVYGAQLGASLAVFLCQRHPELPAVILDSADGDTEERVLRDTRTRLVPMRLLFHERFPLADPLAALRTPKLLISYTSGTPPVDAARAADPKFTLELPGGSNPTELAKAVRRFVSTYVATGAEALTPVPR